MNNKIQIVEIDKKICVIDGVSCSPGYCREYGCDFPNCANVLDDFDTIEEAKIKYPEAEVL